MPSPEQSYTLAKAQAHYGAMYEELYEELTKANETALDRWLATRRRSHNG